jgi:hypothetical protein
MEQRGMDEEDQPFTVFLIEGLRTSNAGRKLRNALARGVRKHDP